MIIQTCHIGSSAMVKPWWQPYAIQELKKTKKRVFCQHLALAIILSSLSLSLHPFWSSTNLCFAHLQSWPAAVWLNFSIKVQKKSKCKHKQKSSSKTTLTYTFKQVIYFNYSQNVGLCTFPIFATKLQSVNECLIISTWSAVLHTQHLYCNAFHSHHITHSNQSICILLS